MLGEKIIIGEDFLKVADKLQELLLNRIQKSENVFVIGIAGESGSGKTGISRAFANALQKLDVKTIIIQQDDYFLLPPQDNDLQRRQDINAVGTSEVQLAMLEENLQEIKNGVKEIVKPLVIFDENKIVSEGLSLDLVKVVIVEGTYTSVLKNVDKKIFINRIYLDTKEARKDRAREEQNEFIEHVLEIENRIISLQKNAADFIITKDFKVRKN